MLQVNAGAPSYRILVVDDNEDAALSLALVLQIIGHQTRTAHDGLVAFETAEAFRPEVVLLDIGLPRCNGYDVCRRLRSQPWGHHMAIIALTGWGRDDDKRRCQEAGFNFHLLKPIEPTELTKLLAGLVLAPA
jgi:CheY-like chemotaxis protein